jgi:hypothetical protein
MKMKEILLKLDDAEYRVVEWISSKLDLSISECLRSFIPRVSPPEIRVVTKESDIAAANLSDLVPIGRELTENDLKELNGILSELNERKWAATLANEIRRQIIGNKATEKHLAVGTYRRLARWVSPYRWSNREQFVKPRAQRISEILFGGPIGRIN